MTRSDWTAIAEVLHVVRASIASCPPSEEQAIHDRKLIYYATLEAIDRVAVLLAAHIRERSSTFDELRFLRHVGVRLSQSYPTTKR